jgi:hypothetical protein
MKHKHKLIIVAVFIALLSKFSIAQVFGPQYAIGGDTCIFDSSCEFIIIDTSQANNLWQIGEPSKIVLDAAYIGIRAIITDSVNVYDTNNISSFTLQLVHQGTRMHEIVFWHKYDTDEGKDGGYIEMSHNLGESWTNIIDYQRSYPLAYQIIHIRELYNSGDSITGGNVGYHGSSGGWIKSSISWDAYTILGGDIDERVNQDTTLVRFTFISDSIPDSKDGWCIDNIIHLLYETYENINPVKKANHVKIYPNPCQDFISYESEIPLTSISIYNPFGTIMGSFDNPNQTIEISELPKGLYYVAFYKNNQIIAVEKLLIID